jgi:hypothetical protein
MSEAAHVHGLLSFNGGHGRDQGLGLFLTDIHVKPITLKHTATQAQAFDPTGNSSP